ISSENRWDSLDIWQDYRTATQSNTLWFESCHLLRRRRSGKLLEARIISERIEHWIELEERGSERAPAKGPAYEIESSFCKAAMARSGSPICAAIRARISSEQGPVNGSFPIGFAAMARSDRANEARPILTSARSPM